MWRIPVDYDTEASCPEWESFISQVFPEDSIGVAYEIAGWLMTPDRSIQKAVLLKGEGNNGKSTYLEGLRRFVGRQNTVSMSLQRLEGDRFAAAAIYGKLANICPDLPGRGLISTSVFKAVIGGDEIQAEYKFRNSFSFRPFCHLIFSANRMPVSPDDSEGFFRRWLVVELTREFAAGGKDTIAQDVLLSSLSSAKEKSGLLNHCLDAVDGLRAHRQFTESETMREARIELRRVTDPFAIWLEEQTVFSALLAIPIHELAKRYADDCIQRGRPVPSAKTITQKIKRLRPKVEVLQRTHEDGARPWSYVGLTWRSTQKEEDKN
jgi:putative DNA primase/helicase